jgi:hypothetical protein
MRQIRDETENRIRDEDRIRVRYRDFSDFVSLNDTLRDEERTVAVFQWLDEQNEEDAGRMFAVAEPALIKHKAYELCGKYVDPEKDISRITENYASGLKLARDRFGESHREFTEKSFLNKVTTLVAILVQTDRTAEAAEVAQQAKESVEDAEVLRKLERQLESALEGTVPKPWP